MLIYTGDCLDILPGLDAGSVHCVVTSPPYYGLRDYGHDGQIGLESTLDEYVAKLVAVFREVRRVLRDDGTVWLNLGDSYASTTKGSGGSSAKQERNAGAWYEPVRFDLGAANLKPKDLIGIPWRVAFALQADGWYLRQDIIWHKPNPMPESVRDRCTKAHEYVFLLSKSARYWYDADAVKDAAIRAGETIRNNGGKNSQMGQYGGTRTGFLKPEGVNVGDSRNRRSVWTIAPQPFKGAHFAVMPESLVQPCIRAGCPEKGVVLDPFAGAGTVGKVAADERRDFIGIELNPDYVAIAEARMKHAGQQPRLPLV